jgi:cell division protein FtsB
MRHTLAIFMLVVLAVLQMRLWTGEGSFSHIYRLEQKVALQAKLNQQLKDRNQTLAAKVNDFKRGLDGVEERARYELGMIKKGETFFLVIN